MSTLDLVFRGKHRVRVVVGPMGEPMWVAKDVCEVLELRGDAGQHTRHLDDDEKGLSVIQTPGGPQEMATITESGLYKLIFSSRKPQAKEFRKWVTGTVLPEIRQTGSFGVQKLMQELMATQERDRKYWLARDTDTNDRLNRQGEEIAKLREEIVGIRHPQAIGRAGGQEIRRRLRDLGRSHVKLDPKSASLTHAQRTEAYLKERRRLEDELRRSIVFPRDTGNSFDSMPSDMSSKVQMHLNTMETQAVREASKREKASREADQQSLFGAGETVKPN